MNLPVNVGEEEEEELRTMLAQLEYGNKISILRWALHFPHLHQTQIYKTHVYTKPRFTQTQIYTAQIYTHPNLHNPILAYPNLHNSNLHQTEPKFIKTQIYIVSNCAKCKTG